MQEQSVPSLNLGQLLAPGGRIVRALASNSARKPVLSMPGIADAVASSRPVRMEYTRLRGALSEHLVECEPLLKLTSGLAEWTRLHFVHPVRPLCSCHP